MQDKYHDLSVSDPEGDKLALFEAAIAHKPAGGLLINLASATKLSLAGVYIQAEVVDFIDKTKPPVLGWSLFDYASASSDSTVGKISCVEFIISSNFDYAR